MYVFPEWCTVSLTWFNKLTLNSPLSGQDRLSTNEPAVKSRVTDKWDKMHDVFGFVVDTIIIMYAYH